jgi:hypothetical protein
MIIGINGKIGSGKDTVGSIIQYLTSDCGDVNNKSYRDYDLFLIMGGNSDWEIKKFAGKLKEIASLLTSIPIEKFEDQEFKKTMLGPEWNMTVRDFLQILGTEGLRDGLHTNVWVNALMCTYDEHSNWIITDMRFPNEMEAVEKRHDIGLVAEKIADAFFDHRRKNLTIKDGHRAQDQIIGHIIKGRHFAVHGLYRICRIGAAQGGAALQQQNSHRHACEAPLQPQAH